MGADYFDRLDTEQLQRRYVRRLEQLGYAVTLTPALAACVIRRHPFFTCLPSKNAA